MSIEVNPANSAAYNGATALSANTQLKAVQAAQQLRALGSGVESASKETAVFLALLALSPAALDVMNGIESTDVNG